MSMGELGSLSVPVRIDMSHFDRGLATIRSRMQSFAGSMARFTKAMVLPSIGGGLAGGYLVKQAADMEAAFSQLRKTTGLSGAAMAKLQGDIKGLATTMAGVSFEDLTKIATMGGRMGISGGRLLQFTKDIAGVSIALDDIPAEEAATRIARTLNVFKLGSENALRFASALNKLDDSSTATGRDILDITTRIAPAAATLGLVPAKVMAIAAALKDAGAENEVAGTAMSQIFGLMAKDMASFAKVAGVSTDAFAKALRRDPMEALKLLSSGIAKLDNLDAFSALSTLGIDGQRATMTLLQLGQVMDKMDGYVATANREWSTTASIQKEVAIAGGTTYAQLQRLTNNLRIMAAEIGAHALPLVKALAGSFGELTTEFRGFLEGKSDRIKGFFDPLVRGARNIGLLFSEWPRFVALTENAIKGMALQVTTVMDRIGDYVARLFTSIAENFRAQFVNAVEDAFRHLVAKTAGVAKFLGPDLLAAMGPLGLQISAIGVAASAPRGPAVPVPPITGGSTAGLFGGLGLRGLGERGVALADERARLARELAAARGAKDRVAAEAATRATIGGFLNNLATGGGLGLAMPGGAAGRALGALPRGLLGGAPVGSMIRGALGGAGRPESREDIVRRNRAAKAAKLAGKRTERARAEAEKRARARARRPGGAKGGAVAALEDIESTSEKHVRVSENILKALERGIVGRLA